MSGGGMQQSVPEHLRYRVLNENGQEMQVHSVGEPIHIECRYYPRIGLVPCYESPIEELDCKTEGS